MGYRLYYTPKYEVEYAGGYFNCQSDKVSQLFAELDVIAYDASDTIYEISKEDFKAKVDALREDYTSRAHEPHPLLQHYTYGSVLSVLDEIIDGTPGSYIHLEWF